MLIKPAWLVVENMVQDQIGHSRFGTFSALFNFAFIFAVLADLGINQFIARKLASSETDRQHTLKHSFAIKLFLLVASPLIITFVGWLLGYQGDKVWFLFVIAFMHSLIQLFLLFRSWFQAAQMFVTDAFASIIEKVLLLGIVVVWMQYGIDQEEFIYARFWSIFIGCLLVLWAAYRYLGDVTPKWEGKRINWLLQKSFPFAIIAFLYSIHERIDLVILERISGENASGLYTGAYRLLDAVMMYLWTILPAFFARFAFYRKDPARQQKVFELGHTIAFLPMAFVSLFVFFYGDKLLFLFTNSTRIELDTMTMTMKILFIAVFIQGLSALYSTLLTSTGYERQTAIMVTGSIILNIVLNLLFIPRYGVYAAAWSTVLCHTLLFVLYAWYIAKRTNVSLPWDLLMKLGLITIGMALVFGLSTFYSFHWIIISALALIAGIIPVLVLRLLVHKEV